MKVTSLTPVNRTRCDTLKSDQCDNQCDNHCDTEGSNRVKVNEVKGFITCHTGKSTVTRRTKTTVTPKIVTVVVQVIGQYLEGLRMSKKDIKAVWLTVERVAELRGCSVRTVWRAIRKDNMLTYKKQVKIGYVRVLKTFVMPNPELMRLEMADCDSRGVVPADYFEQAIQVGNRCLNCVLIYGYRDKAAEGGQDETV